MAVMSVSRQLAFSSMQQAGTKRHYMDMCVHEVTITLRTSRAKQHEFLWLEPESWAAC